VETFTPYSALAGGLLIGGAATLLLWFNGRIAGVSSISGNLLAPRSGDVLWRLLFLAGLVAGAAAYCAAFGNPAPARPAFPPGLLIAAGVLVGFGTSLGGGCTSGHGVCGLGRLSAPFRRGDADLPSDRRYGHLRRASHREPVLMAVLLVNIVAGLLFGLGLALSGMTRPEKVLGFLDFAGRWDPSLLFVLGGAVTVTVISFRFILRRPKPLLGETFHLSAKKRIDAPLLIGSAIFGVGWGISGYCPGPAVALLAVPGSAETWLFLPALLFGQLIHRLLQRAWRNFRELQRRLETVTIVVK
jgi:uncharacterized membrane protein YedE/YeeE